MIPSTTVTNIASNIQKCNTRIVSLQQNKSHGCTLPSVSSVPPFVVKKIETSCIAVITVSYQKLLGALHIPSRKKIKPCLATLPTNPLKSFLPQAEMVIDKFMVNNCSSCNNIGSGSSEDKRRSSRYVYLNENTCVMQNGVYYGHNFVPDKKGKLLGWFSYPGSKPNHISARVCCLLNSIHLSIGNKKKSVIKDFNIMNIPKDSILGPLEKQCLQQHELEEYGPIIVFLMFVSEL